MELGDHVGQMPSLQSVQSVGVPKPRASRAGTVRIHTASAARLLLDDPLEMEESPKMDHRRANTTHFGHSLSAEESFAEATPGTQQYEVTKRAAVDVAARKAAQRKAERILMRHAWYQKQAALPGKITRARPTPHAEFSARVELLLAGNALTRRADTLVKERDAALEERKRSDSAAWNKQVYEPIVGDIRRAVDSVRGRERTEERNAEYERFLNAAKDRAGLFLSDDVLTRDKGKDYDPMAFTERMTHRVRPRIHDPIRQFMERGAIERAEGPRGVRSSKRSLPETTKRRGGDTSKANAAGLASASGASYRLRETLGTEWWPDEKIASTPHGYFSFVGHGKRTSSHRPTAVLVDQYHVIRSNEVANEDLPPMGKRVIPGTRPLTRTTDHHEPAIYSAEDRDVHVDIGILPDVSRSTKAPTVGSSDFTKQ